MQDPFRFYPLLVMDQRNKKRDTKRYPVFLVPVAGLRQNKHKKDERNKQSIFRSSIALILPIPTKKNL